RRTRTHLGLSCAPRRGRGGQAPTARRAHVRDGGEVRRRRRGRHRTRMTAKVHGEKAKEGLRRVQQNIQAAAHFILAAGITAAEQSAKASTLYKDRSGKTRASGKVVARGASIFLENGTKAHTITARNGGMLRFFVNGQAVFRRSVRHPGTGPRPTMGNARYHAELAIGYAAEIYLNEALA